jgi:hypothetical protein
MRVELRATYEAEPDKYFWLRDAPDGTDVDDLRRQVASVFAGLTDRAFMMLDSAVAGERRGAAAVLEAAMQFLHREEKRIEEIRLGQVVRGDVDELLRSRGVIE